MRERTFVGLDVHARSVQGTALDADTGELAMTSLYEGVSADDARAATGWPLRVADEPEQVAPPTEAELAALRALRTVSGEDGAA